MKINISRIKKQLGVIEQIEFEEQLEGKFLPKSVKLQGPVTVQATATNAGDCIAIKGRLKANLLVQCDRCLAEFVTEVKAPLEEQYYPLPEGEMEGKFIDYATYENNLLDLTPLLEETILLALPMKPLCQEKCQGLCAKCGQNLNIASCDCAHDNIDIRLESLKKLLENDQ